MTSPNSSSRLTSASPEASIATANSVPLTTAVPPATTASTATQASQADSASSANSVSAPTVVTPSGLAVWYPASCDNAPRQRLLIELNMAFAEGDTDTIASFVAPDIRWEMIGDRVLEGKDAFVAQLRSIEQAKAVSLHVASVLTHGREAAAHGVLDFGGGRRIAFCDVYRFASTAKSALIRSITSYAVDLSDGRSGD